MKESFWGIFIVLLGTIAIILIFFFQEMTNTSEQNYTLLRETTEAAMYDAVDVAAYRQSGIVRINREKFVENFIRRFSESANLKNTYIVEIYDVNEVPPKVSLKVKTSVSTTANNEQIDVELTNRLDAILETPY
jgi:hypothetical protein